jgi:acyl transferase domain-containing protein
MSEPIAVIGMGCRFPGGVHSPEQLWDLLSSGRDAGGPVPHDRWNADAFFNPDPEAKESINSKSGYFLTEDIRAFDARFFECRPYEAHTMDPQQRIILETTYEALENAGLRLEDIDGSDTAVFVGVYGRDYDRMGYKDLPLITKGHTTGAGEAVLSNRISYLLNLKGASMTIDTGCVSELDPMMLNSQ